MTIISPILTPMWLLIALLIFTNTNDSDMFKQLQKYCSTLNEEFSQIDESRKNELLKLSRFITDDLLDDGKSQQVVICTHNSRRSHFGQLWLTTAAEYYGIKGVESFSGGTEATAFHPNAVAAAEEAGFSIRTTKGKFGESNPAYVVSIGKTIPPQILYSKKYEDEPNPTSDFIAIMVCSDADVNCPVVKGAKKRIALPFEDPKHFDNTPSQKEKYNERCRQIAREIFFVMSNVKSALIVAEESGQ